MENQLIKKDLLFNYEKYEKETDENTRIKMCLDYIKQKLKTKSISVMVGAGFSLNANVRKNKNEPQYEDWLSLLTPAYKEVYPDNIECINGGDEAKIKDKIQAMGESAFAEEYEKSKGSREFLDLYIEGRINKIDKATDDLTLHYRLLDNNWCDIITTNWDDLLERANQKSEKFTPILSAKDLRCRNNNRIVKLHGSIRKKEEIENKTYNFDNTYNYLYLITSTDFANYKTEHEDFSNFMKVKILENPFCLMGFSGRDSNFRYWVKELKRTMLKGGTTEQPNPIFLFDVNPKTTDAKDIEYEKALDLFYHNNYIIRLKILNYYNHLNGSVTQNNQTVNSGKGVVPVSNQNNVTHQDLNNFVFDYLMLNETLSNNEQEQADTFENESIKKNEYAILYNIAAKKEILDLNDFEQYNKINLFSFQNLSNTSSFIFLIQNFNKNSTIWSENTFIFLYRWCLGNYYSLANLYEENIINHIIEIFENSNYIETDAYVFAELILKYYREQNDERKLNTYYEKLLKYPQCNNIVIYSRAWRFIDNLEYNSLKLLLNNWHPEEGEQPDSLFIIRKISLLHMFENIRFYEDMKEEISALFKIALDNCKEEQLKLFILLFQRQYNNVFFIQADDSNEKLIKQLREKELSEPYKYLDEFETKTTSNSDIKSNESKRYTITWKLSGNDSNQGFLNSIRVLNFFEYTGLSMELFLATKKIKSLITNMKTSDYYLSKMFVHCISYFGNDSDEDYVKFSVDKIVRYLNSETIINIYNAIYKILFYKVEHQRNARSYLFICNELSKYFNDKSSKLSKFIYSEIKESKDSNYQIVNLIRRGRFWGAKRVFEDYLLKIQDEKEYKFILEWIITEYIKDERELVKQQHYTSSEFFDYYFDLLVKNPKKDLIQELINQSDVIKLLEEDFSYEKQLCLYGYEFLPKDLSKKTKEFFETNFTIYTDPYFITIFKSDTLKNKIISIVKDDNPLSFNSRKYQITKYIRFLNHEKMFDLNDKILISNIIKTRIEKILSNKDYFSHGFTSLKDTIADLFYCLENITSEQDRNSSLEIKNIYDLVKTEFQNQIQDFYSFEWLYTDDYQKFRISFSNAVSYFSCLHQSEQYLYIFNIVLSKLIVEDNNDFEAVLELFITIYSNKYENNILENNETHTLLLQLMKKYSIEIPFCYDYLFIKQQMKLLAENLKQNNINDDVIDFWISN